jgi:hypothetical protein
VFEEVLKGNTRIFRATERILRAIASNSRAAARAAPTIQCLRRVVHGG